MADNVTQTETTARGAVAEEVRALLGRRRMSDIALARAMGRSHTYVYRRLSGEIAFDVDDLEKIAQTLRVEMVDLLPRVTRGYMGPDLRGTPAVDPRSGPTATVPSPVRRPPGRADARRPVGGPPPTRGRTTPTGRW